MIEAYRLLVAQLNDQGGDWNYPIHLGVTEAGDGEDGRIKSAIGIGSLLADGIGDTIRVSLTEDAVYEIPVAQALVKPYNEGAARPLRERCPAPPPVSYDPFDYERRASAVDAASMASKLGGDETVAVFTTPHEVGCRRAQDGQAGRLQAGGRHRGQRRARSRSAR